MNARAGAPGDLIQLALPPHAYGRKLRLQVAALGSILMAQLVYMHEHIYHAAHFACYVVIECICPRHRFVLVPSAAVTRRLGPLLCSRSDWGQLKAE